MIRVCPTNAATRGGIATLLAILFAVGSILSINPDVHALMHAENSAEHSHSDDGETDADHGSQHSEGCFLCELLSGAVDVVDCGAAEFRAAPSLRRGRVELPVLYISTTDCRLPPILGPPIA